MKPNKMKHKILFLIPLLGLITSFLFGFSPNSNIEHKYSKVEFHSVNNSKTLPVLKHIDEEDYERTKLIIDESEFEFDLELNTFENSNFNLPFLKLCDEVKIRASYYNFFALHYKIPLYKLFCKWKIHLN